MIAIYKRELKSYFQSMLGCVFIAFLIAYTGVYFVAYNLYSGYPYFAYTLSGALFIFIVGIPLITMKSFAEERRNKTDQVLLTAPVSLTKVVLGKYLAMVTVVAIPNLIFCVYPLIINHYGVSYLKIDYLSILTFFLLGCVFVAIGMFMSALTESQIIAFISAFGVLMALYLCDSLIGFLPSSAIANMIGLIVILSLIVYYIYRMTSNWLICGILEVVSIAGCAVVYAVRSSFFESLLANLLGRLAITDTFTNIVSNSILDMSGVVLYVSLAVLFIFLTIQAIQKRRWS